MSRIINFYSDSMKLGMNKPILLVSMLLYFASVFFEAIGIFLILPLISLIFTDQGLEAYLGSQKLVMQIIEYIQLAGFGADKYTIATILFIAILLRQIVVFARACWNTAIMAKLVFYLRKQAFSKFLSVKENFFIDTSSGSTINDLTEEVQNTSNVIMGGVELIGICCIFVVYLFMMFYLSFIFTIFALSSFILTVLFLKKIWRQSSAVGTSITKNNRLFMIHIGQRFGNLRLLKLTGDEEHERFLVKKILSEQRKKQVKSGILISITNSCIEPIILIVGGTILYAAVAFLNQDLVNLGIFTIIMMRGIPMVRNAFSSWQTIETQWPSLKAVLHTFDNLDKNKEKYSGNKKLNAKIAPSIVFKSVDYSYKNREEKVIKSASFEIQAGELTAIIGPSGAGKSTIVDCLPRLKIPDRGNIYINDIDINELNLLNLRKNIGFLAQEPQIIEGSIKDHISFGSTNIKDEDIIKAMIKVNCAPLLDRLEDGINTNIGANGAKLSGGERQRIDLARVLARKTPILILDEPASNLDAITEKAIYDAISNEKKDRPITVIVIGHRLKWFKNFDKVIIINEGIVEYSGSHDEAIKTSEWYSSAIRTQN